MTMGKDKDTSSKDKSNPRNNTSKRSTEHTVFIRFVPPSSLLRRHHIEDHFSQIGPIKKASLIVSKSADEKASSYGFIKYTCEADAIAAAKQLHRSTLELPAADQDPHAPNSFQVMVELASLQLQKQQQQKVPEVKQEPTTDAPGVADPAVSEQRKKHNRVILRNLSFYAKESHIQSALRGFGQVVDVHIPTVQGRSRGFAFCTFATAQQAELAVRAPQVVVHERPVQVEWSVPKKVHQQRQEVDQKKKIKKEYQELVREELKQQERRDPQQSPPPKEEEKEEHGEESSNDEEGSSSDSDGEDDSEDDSEDGEKEKPEGSEKEVKKDAEGDAKEEEEDEEEEEEEENLQLAVQEQRELFVRNLPFDATRTDVFEAFRPYGKIQAIYLVTDKATKLPRGTAFVTYEKQAGAARAMKQAGAGADEKGGLMLKGRPLLLDYAVDKETADTLRKDSPTTLIKVAKDKRNIYLKTEGRVDDEQVWQVLSESDKLKRQKAWTDKHTKLKSPLFFINPLRLSIRNISKSVDEADLKKLLFQATQRGLEKGLVNVLDFVNSWKAEGELTAREILQRMKDYQKNGSVKDEDNPLLPESLDERNTKRTIPSVYLDRDFEAAKKGDKKAAPSRGFAFAEFTHHVQALACLRELNNNPAYSAEFAAGGRAAATAAAQKRRTKLKKQKKSAKEEDDAVGRIPRLIVEFTVENKAKAKQQNDRRAQQRENRDKQKLENKEKKELTSTKRKKVVEEAASKKLGRGAKQRERKRQRRLEKEQGGGDETTPLEVAEAQPRNFQKLSKRNSEEDEQGDGEKPKRIKPRRQPNKRQREDKETEENFTKLVNKYKSEFREALGGTEKKEAAEAVNPRKAALAEGKRWYEKE